MSTHNLFPIAFLDAPQVLNTTVTPIPGSGSPTLQVVADIGFKSAYAIDYVDSTGDYIGVYLGPSGSEVLHSIIGGGVVSRAYVVIAAHSRVSFRSLTAKPITDGYLSCVFMGMGWAGGSS
jgi:hypothetical protein